MSSLELWRSAMEAAAPRRRRSLLEWAEAELPVVDGPFRGLPFRVSRQPWSAAWLGAVEAAIEGETYRRFALAGPTQSGKTLCGLVIPVLYVALELGEPIILGAPDALICADKWQVDLLPTIRASSYANRLPTIGQGSRGGTTDQHFIRLGAGSVRMMHARGGDKSRAGFSARAVLLTEVDGMDEIRGGSREADPVTQLEARTSAYGTRGLVFMECTVSTEGGRTWREYLSGTRSSIVSPCPRCGAFVAPERENLGGWQGATDLVSAGELARWTCPKCAAELGERDRIASLERARILHHGQEITQDGTVSGSAARTDTLSLRVSAWSNAFVPTSELGRREWKGRRDGSEAAERSLRQFTWVLPLRPEKDGDSEVSALDRIDPTLPRGAAPAGTVRVVGGVDVGAHLCHWTLAGLKADGSLAVGDYGIQEVPSGDMAEERAIAAALRAIAERFELGLAILGEDRSLPASLVLVDAGYRQEVVIRTAAKLAGWNAAKGRGSGQRELVYRAPTRRSSTVTRIGVGWHVAKLGGGAGTLVHWDADAGKSALRARLETPRGAGGGFTLYDAPERDHLTFSKHLEAERLTTEWDARRGWVDRWRARRSANHFLDSTTLAVVAGWIVGIRPETDPETVPKVSSGTASKAPSRRRRSGGLRMSPPNTGRR